MLVHRVRLYYQSFAKFEAGNFEGKNRKIYEIIFWLQLVLSRAAQVFEHTDVAILYAPCSDMLPYSKLEDDLSQTYSAEHICYLAVDKHMFF